MTIATLLAKGASQREVERVTGIDRKTIRAYQQRLAEERANSPGVATGSAEQIPPPWPPAPVIATPSACAPHRRGDLPGPRGPVRLRRRIQQRQALRAPAVRERTGAIRPAGVRHRRGSPGRLRRRRADPRAGHRAVPQAAAVRDDAAVFAALLPEGGLEVQPGDLGAAARASMA